MRLKGFAARAIGNHTVQSTARLKNILVPIDFSPASKKAFKYAFRFAEKFSAQITLLHVLEPPPSSNFAGLAGAPAFSETAQLSAKKSLQALIGSTRNGSVGRTRITMRTGVPSHEIVELAKEADIDLIVIAALGYTGSKHFCIGSTAERVARAAPCPVLLVRKKE